MVTPRGYTAVEPEDSLAIEPAKDPHDQAQPQDDLYPLTLNNMRHTRAVVIGGGPVGQRKTEGLLQSGANVRLVSPAATPALQALAETGQIEWIRRPYQNGDLTGAQLVFAATNQRAVNRQVALESGGLGVLCNVADRPEDGNFHVPAVHRQPNLMVAVSTVTRNPKQAKLARDKIRTCLKNGEAEIGRSRG